MYLRFQLNCVDVHKTYGTLVPLYLTTIFFFLCWLYCWRREVATVALISYLAKSSREDTLSIKSSSVNSVIHPSGSSSYYANFTGSVEQERAESMKYITEEKHQDCGKQEQTKLGVPKCASIEHQTLYYKQQKHLDLIISGKWKRWETIGYTIRKKKGSGYPYFEWCKF